MLAQRLKNCENNSAIRDTIVLRQTKTYYTATIIPRIVGFAQKCSQQIDKCQVGGARQAKIRGFDMQTRQKLLAKTALSKHSNNCQYLRAWNSLSCDGLRENIIESSARSLRHNLPLAP